MVETELKLRVPRARRSAVERELAAGGRSTALRLQAVYFDTADRRLAEAGLALRLRKEGRRWVQALKGAGADPLQRLEHEVALVGSAQPAVDVSRHAGTPAGGRLAALLDGGAPLLEVFRTDVRRRTRSARSAAGSVELALDIGAIVAGDERLALCELEVELQRGAPAAVLEVARRWVERHALVLDLRSKAERGAALARGERVAAASKARSPRLDRHGSEAEAFGAALASCLQQILANAAALTDGEDAGAEHVHQLRIGLRRLRTALRLFDDMASTDLDTRAAALFRRLGSARDRDALAAGVLPALRAAGAPLAELPPPADGADDAAPAQVLAEPAASLLWLDLLELLQRAPGATVAADAEPPPLRKALGARLRPWQRKVRRDASRFDELDAEARHGLRKRVKRLRYAVEFCGSAYPRKAVERYLKRLRPLQEALGVLNDLQVAGAAFERATADDPRAWFALGWLASRREVALGECRAALLEFCRAKPFWS